MQSSPAAGSPEAWHRAGAAPKSSGYRVVVTGLPKSASWQDLKDHFRRAGEVTFTQVPGLLQAALAEAFGALLNKRSAVLATD